MAKHSNVGRKKKPTDEMTRLTSRFKKLRISNVGQCDAVTALGKKCFSEHKCMLSAYSSYLRALFTSGTIESKERKVSSHNLDGEAVQSIMDWTYTNDSNVGVDDSNVQALLAASDFLQITEAHLGCCDYLKKKINPANCLGIREIALRYSCPDLLVCATDYILDETQKVFNTEEFLKLTVDRLIEIISNDALRVSSEKKVYEAVMRWVQHVNSQYDDRTIHLSKLLHHVRLSLMDPSYLVKNVSENPLIKANPECQQYVNRAKDYLLLRWSSGFKNMKHMHKARFRQKKANISDGKLFVVASRSSVLEIETLDSRKNKWTSQTETDALFKFSSVLLNDIIYVLGGRNSDKSLSTIRLYDLHKRKWIDNPVPFATWRHNFGAIALQGSLYVIGGLDENDANLDLVAKYDPLCLTWSKCAPLRRPRFEHRVVALDGYIYVLGGMVDGRHENTVERYDSYLDDWEYVEPMTTHRKYFGCAAYDGYIYVVGGKDEDGRATATGERYDPTKDSWEPVPPMRQKRYNHGLAELNGLLYAIGGCNLRPLKSVEVYDPVNRSWSKGPTMSSQYSEVRIAYEAVQ